MPWDYHALPPTTICIVRCRSIVETVWAAGCGASAAIRHGERTSGYGQRGGATEWRVRGASCHSPPTQRTSAFGKRCDAAEWPGSGREADVSTRHRHLNQLRSDRQYVAPSVWGKMWGW